jgi:hypothetical protein
MTKAEIDERWRKRAIEYREALEAQTHLLVVVPCRLNRMLIVRYHSPHLKPEIREVHSMRGQLHYHLEGTAQHRLNRRNNVTTIVRVWIVRDSVEPFTEHSRWNSIHMARAHRDGRLFHYAKHLMTEDSDKWTSDLSGGVPNRRI